MRAFHASFGRARIGAQRVDIELEHRPAKVRDTAPGLVGHHAGAIAVERQRLAVTLQIRARGLEVAESRFGHGEVQLHQPAGGIVHIHQQRALRRPVLEPPMLAAVDLDQFAHT
jgi:hypothetical protein